MNAHMQTVYKQYVQYASAGAKALVLPLGGTCLTPGENMWHELAPQQNGIALAIQNAWPSEAPWFLNLVDMNKMTSNA